MANAVFAEVVSWLVGESLKSGAQIYGQQLSMGIVTNIEPLADDLSVSWVAELFTAHYTLALLLQ